MALDYSDSFQGGARSQMLFFPFEFFNFGQICFFSFFPDDVWFLGKGGTKSSEFFVKKTNTKPKFCQFFLHFLVTKCVFLSKIQSQNLSPLDWNSVHPRRGPEGFASKLRVLAFWGGFLRRVFFEGPRSFSHCLPPASLQPFFQHP